jgi:ABC-type multidrug transport system ATPase subunit
MYFTLTAPFISTQFASYHISTIHSHCYVVKQHDKHWPYLTCRETLRYAAELYDVARAADLEPVLNEIIKKMGLTGCADTRNSDLSGGQKRRLSIGIALLKQPTLLFLDEPTSGMILFEPFVFFDEAKPLIHALHLLTGLDAASASNIMQEIVRVAKEERLIIMCTIHQPSTKVFNGFDELMIMSRGRTAYAGDVNESVDYFQSIGYPIPAATNPAEYYLDLVNSDFSDEAAVTSILDTWEEKGPGAASSHHKQGFDVDAEGQEGVTDMKGAGILKEVQIMLRRHFVLVYRDPILYIGRSLVFLVSNLIFAFVYWAAREPLQEQALNKMWITIWYIAVPSNMGVVAVFALNDEFKSILRESKNGMVSGGSYLLAKTIITLPILFVFALFSLGIPMFAVQDVPKEAFGIMMILFAAVMFVFESLAECLSVWVEDPILGMLQFMNVWFASFLFGGFLIPKRDLYWPFELFYYIMPFNYFVGSSMYEIFTATKFEPCTDITTSAVCVDSTNGTEVLAALGRVIPLFSTSNQTTQDIGVLLAIGAFYKLLYVVGVFYKTSQFTKFVDK